MKITPDGKLDMWAKQDLKVLEEFAWNAEDMAKAIRELREEIYGMILKKSKKN